MASPNRQQDYRDNDPGHHAANNQGRSPPTPPYHPHRTVQSQALAFPHQGHHSPTYSAVSAELGGGVPSIHKGWDPRYPERNNQHVVSSNVQRGHRQAVLNQHDHFHQPYETLYPIPGPQIARHHRQHPGPSTEQQSTYQGPARIRWRERPRLNSWRFVNHIDYPTGLVNHQDAQYDRSRNTAEQQFPPQHCGDALGILAPVQQIRGLQAMKSTTARHDSVSPNPVRVPGHNHPGQPAFNRPATDRQRHEAHPTPSDPRATQTVRKTAGTQESVNALHRQYEKAWMPLGEASDPFFSNEALSEACNAQAIVDASTESRSRVPSSRKRHRSTASKVSNVLDSHIPLVDLTEGEDIIPSNEPPHQTTKRKRPTEAIGEESPPSKKQDLAPSPRVRKVKKPCKIKHLNNYPHRDEPLPDGIGANELIQKYPNHLQGERLLNIKECGWTLKDILEAAGENGLTRGQLSTRLSLVRSAKHPEEGKAPPKRKSLETEPSGNGADSRSEAPPSRKKPKLASEEVSVAAAGPPLPTPQQPLPASVRVHSTCTAADAVYIQQTMIMDRLQREHPEHMSKMKGVKKYQKIAGMKDYDRKLHDHYAELVERELRRKKGFPVDDRELLEPMKPGTHAQTKSVTTKPGKGFRGAPEATGRLPVDAETDRVHDDLEDALAEEFDKMEEPQTLGSAARETPATKTSAAPVAVTQPASHRGPSNAAKRGLRKTGGGRAKKI